MRAWCDPLWCRWGTGSTMRGTRPKSPTPPARHLPVNRKSCIKPCFDCLAHGNYNFLCSARPRPASAVAAGGLGGPLGSVALQETAPDSGLTLRPRAGNWSTNCHKFARIREDRIGSKLPPRRDQESQHSGSDRPSGRSRVLEVSVLHSQDAPGRGIRGLPRLAIAIWRASDRAGKEPGAITCCIGAPGKLRMHVRLVTGCMR
jgi:hypothetical protein